jgi:hypothetical protein
MVKHHGTARRRGKMSKGTMVGILVVLVAGGGYLAYGLISGNWLLSMGMFPSGFLSSTISSVNGYDLGTPQFATSGTFAIPGNGMTFNGHLQAGDVYYDNYSDVGWIQDGNTSMAVRLFNFHQYLLGYTAQSVTDQVPGANLRSEILGLAYKYQFADFWGTSIIGATQSYYLTANTLGLPANWLACVNQRLDMNVELNIKLNPALLKVQSFNTTDQFYNFTSVWAGVLDAHAGAAFATGLVSDPGTAILAANFTANPPADPAGVVGGDYARVPNAYSQTIPAAIGNWIVDNDPVGEPAGFDVLTSATSATYQASTANLGMGKGDPIPLTEGDYNANTSLDADPTHYRSFLADDNRGNVKGYIPMSLCPNTTITNTTYTFNEIQVKQNFFNLVPTTGSSILERTVTRPTAIAVSNRWVMQMVNFTIAVVSNYTVHSRSCGEGGACISLPLANETDAVFDPVQDDLVAASGGNHDNNLWDDFLGSGGLYIFVIVAAVAVVVVVACYYSRNRQGNPAGGSR